MKSVLKLKFQIKWDFIFISTFAKERGIRLKGGVKVWILGRSILEG